MSKIKILVPLDTTERSMHSLNWIKKYFNINDIEITLMNVIEVTPAEDIVVQDEVGNMEKIHEIALDKAVEKLKGYTVEKFSTSGYAADQILKKAEEDNYDMIIMTRSTKKGLVRIMGSVTSKVTQNSTVSVTVLPE